MKKTARFLVLLYVLMLIFSPLTVYAQSAANVVSTGSGSVAVGGGIVASPVTTSAATPNSPASQAPGALSLSPPDTDLSVGYLSNIFGTVDGVLAGTGSQLLGAMFGIFNGAVLVLGGIVILYTLFVSTINTAHEGEVLGKQWSSIWIPLRSVIGIALLVPKATGYSFIQIFMVWVVVMGVGAADSVWNGALDYFLRGGIIIQQNLNLSSTAPGGPTTAITSTSATLLRSLTCVEMLYQQLTLLRQNQISSNNNNPIPAVPNFYSDIQSAINSNLAQGATVNLPTSNYMYTNGVCGTLSWLTSAPSGNIPTTGLTPQALQQMNESRGLAVQTMVTQLYGAARQIVANAMQTPSSGNQYELGHILNKPTTPYIWGAGTLTNPTRPLLAGNVLSNAAGSYFGIMGPTLNYLQNSQKFSGLANQWITSAKAAGWIMAGSYYQQLIALNQGMSITEPNPPGFDATAITTLATNIGGIFPAGSAYVQNINSLLLDNTSLYTVGSTSPFITDVVLYGQSLSYGNIGFNPSLPGSTSGAQSNVNALIGSVTGPIGPMFGVFSNLANAQANNQNPVIMLAALGALLVNITTGIFIGLAITIFVLTTALGIAFGFTFSTAIVGTVMPILALFTPILLALLVAGLVMALYIPIIPFIIFTFGAIGWVIAVIEAVIAAPLVALGIAHPEGQPILGKAEPAVGLLVNVFLRPTFMIFGLLIGMMLSYVGLWILNAGFWPAYQSVQNMAVSNQGNGTGSGFVSMFAGLAAIIIYTLLVQQVVQKSFTLIYIIPDEVLKWIGINIKGMGGEAEAERAVAGGAHDAAQKGGEAVSKGPETAHAFSKSVGKAQGAAADAAPPKQEPVGLTEDSKTPGEDTASQSSTPNKGAGTGKTGA
jgi:defect-in-organelle-trafficking protein DotA